MPDVSESHDKVDDPQGAADERESSPTDSLVAARFHNERSANGFEHSSCTVRPWNENLEWNIIGKSFRINSANQSGRSAAW